MVNTKFLQNVWSLTRAYWFSEEKWYARGLLAAIVALNLGFVYVLVLLNAWNNTFYNALQRYDKDGFFSALGEFAVLAAIYIIIAVYQQYLQQMLELKWRRWMTEHYLKNWLSNRTYYRMQLVDNRTDNPDQRISEDLKLFANITLRLALGMLKAVVTLASFIVILWRLSGSLSVPLGSYQLNVPGYLVWAALGYAIAGTWLTLKIGKPLVGLNFNQQRYEADFRFSLVRLRENSESIAFYGGERQEQAKFMERFKQVFANFWTLMQQQKRLTWFTSGYFQIAIIFPLVVAAPRYFSGQIQLGGLIQISSAFGRVQDSLSFFVDSFPLLAEWQAVVNRLLGFVNNMQAVQVLAQADGIERKQGEHNAIQAIGLSIVLPNNQPLLAPINLELKPGESMLITGPSGCGKSTLMRTLAGLWPFGQGQIVLPREQSLLFLPQKSYLPLGSLRDALLYSRQGTGVVSDDSIKEAMSLCRLDHLTGSLDQVEDWSHILSLGEQQRIAFVRALLQKPSWLFLDEATSALDEATERTLYKVLFERLPETTVVSVGHRSSLTGYHHKKFTIDAAGGWTVLS